MRQHYNFCKKEIKDGENYISINKGIYTEEGDKDWIALIFHNHCWHEYWKESDRKNLPIVNVEV